jgi:hypothetical protein
MCPRENGRTGALTGQTRKPAARTLRLDSKVNALFSDFNKERGVMQSGILA